MKKSHKIIYWIATLWLATGMFSTGAEQLLKGKEGPGGTESVVNHMGYPLYFLTIIGIWKILGVVALLIPKFTLAKEWAYAGFFFIMSGAVLSHIATGTVSGMIPSLVLLILTFVSWYFRPVDRKLILAHQ